MRNGQNSTSELREKGKGISRIPPTRRSGYPLSVLQCKITSTTALGKNGPASMDTKLRQFIGVSPPIGTPRPFPSSRECFVTLCTPRPDRSNKTNLLILIYLRFFSVYNNGFILFRDFQPEDLVDFKYYSIVYFFFHYAWIDFLTVILSIDKFI